MRTIEKLKMEIENLDEETIKQVLNYVEFLKNKREKEINKIMDLVIDENIEVFKELAK